MLVPRGGDRDACGADENHVAVDVLGIRALAPGHDEWIVARVGGRHDPGVALDDRARLRARRSDLDVGSGHIMPALHRLSAPTRGGTRHIHLTCASTAYRTGCLQAGCH